MALQPRAEATRRRILDAAITLFSEGGYSSTSLTDIVGAARLSKGAFYYHFAAKDDVAAALVEEYHRALVQTWSVVTPDAPIVRQMIATTIGNQARLVGDRHWQVAQNLLSAQEQVAPGSAGIMEYWRDYLIELSRLAHAAGELRPDLDPTVFGEGLLMSIMGTHMVSASSEDDPVARVARAWRNHLSTTVPAEDLAGYQKLCADLLIRYSYP